MEMGKMEEAVLQNSKGATYMSFVLDVEIILKRKQETETVNLASSKIKNESQDPIKKVQEDKDVKQFEESKVIKTPPPEEKDTSPQPEKKKYTNAAQSETRRDTSAVPFEMKEDLNIYRATIKHTNNFVGQSNIVPEEKLSKLFDNEYPTFHEQSEAIEVSTGEHANVSLPNKHTIKNKITKKKQKSKVFKAKIEKIDFLECNRIFMCNYLKVQNNKPFIGEFNCSSKSEPKMIKSNAKITDRYRKTVSNQEMEFSAFETLALDFRMSTILKKRISCLSVASDNIHQRNSTGDCGKVNPVARLKISSSANFKQRGNVEWCSSYNYYDRINSTRNVKKMSSIPCLNCVCKQSYQNVFTSNNELFIVKAIKKHKSLPNNIHGQYLSGYKRYHRNTKVLKFFKTLNKYKNDISLAANIVKQKILVPEKYFKDCSESEVKFPHHFERPPNYFRYKMLNCASKPHKLKGAVSTCEISDIKNEFTVLRTKSLGCVQQFYEECGNNKLSVEPDNTKVLQTFGTEIKSGDKLRNKRRIWRIISEFVTKMVMKQCGNHG